MVTGRTIERLVIEVGHEVDGAALDKARAEARAAAEEIRKEFDVTAEQVSDAADKIAKENEDAANKTSEVWTGALRQVGSKITDFASAIPGQIVSFISDTFTGIREVDTFAQSIGVGTSELIALEKGFERVRVPADNTREAVKTLTENLGEMRRLGSGPAVDSLGSLGLELADLDGLNTEQTLKVLADALAGVEDESKRTSIAIELMGEDGRALLPALLEGADGVQSLTDAAREAGQVLDEETIERTRELDRQLGELKGTAEGVALTVLSKAAPSFGEAADKAEDWIEQNQEFIEQDLPSIMDSIADGLLAVAAATAKAAEGFVWAKEKASEFAEGWAEWELGVKLDFALNPRTGEYISEAARDQTQGVRGQGARGQAAVDDARAQQARQEAQDYQAQQQAALDADRKRQNAERDSLERRDAARKFEDEQRNKGKRGGKKREDREQIERENVAAFAEEQPELVARLEEINARFGGTEEGLYQAQLSAYKATARGGNTAAARKAGLQSIGTNTNTKNIEKEISRDPLSQLLGVDALPDASPADISQDRAPQVLTATINNTYTISNQFAISGATRPDLVPDQVIDRMRDVFEDQVNKSGNFSKVVLAR